MTKEEKEHIESIAFEKIKENEVTIEYLVTTEGCDRSVATITSLAYTRGVIEAVLAIISDAEERAEVETE